MAADTNTIVLVGRLTRDPDLRAVGSTHVLGGRLAFTRREKHSEEWSDVSGYVDVTLAWGSRAEALARYLTKGSRIAVTGELRWREYEKDGDKRQVLDISARDVQMLDSKGEGGESRPSGDSMGAPPARPSGGGGGGDDDDIPFAPSRV